MTRRSCVLAGLVALGILALYVTIQPSVISSYDGQMTVGIGRNLWEHGSLTRLDSVPTGGVFARYDLGLSLVTAPLWGVQLAVDSSELDWVTLANPILLAAAAGVLVLMGLELRWKPVAAVATGVAFALLTTAPWHSTEAFAEPGVTLGMLTALLGLLLWRRGRNAGPWLVGTGVAFAIVFRVDSLLLVGAAPLFIPLFVNRERLRDEWTRWIPAIVVPLAIAIGQLAFYNHYRTGSVLRGPPTSDPGFTTPVLDGLHLIIVSPGKGLIWFAPILVLAIPGTAVLWHRDRPVAATITALVALRLMFYAAWWAPDGRAAWGPRFLLPAFALLAVGVGAIWNELPSLAPVDRRVVQGATAVLVAGGAVVTILSIWVPYGQVWSELHAPDGIPPDEYSVVVEQRIDEWRYSVADSHIVRNAELIDESDPFPLKRWRGGPTLAGVVSLVAGVGLLGFSYLLARRWSPPTRTRRPPTNARPETSLTTPHRTPKS